jgi:XTP/dITP diphosphohydrolase
LWPLTILSADGQEIAKMKKLIFATGNPHKVKEVNEMLGGTFEVLSLKDIGCTEDIPETRPTIAGNALQKAEYVLENYGVDCFSEDTGLEVDALGGAPGVLSARYAGSDRDSDANMNLLLKNLEGKENRSARFRTVIALKLKGETHTFEGIAEGTIRHERSGQGGFGYDPIFEPLGHNVTFAELSSQEKNTISHRGQAVRKLVAYLEKLA